MGRRRVKKSDAPDAGGAEERKAMHQMREVPRKEKRCTRCGRCRGKKSDAPDAGGAEEIVTTSDERGAEEIVTTSDAGGAEEIVTTSDAGGAQQIVTTLDARGAEQIVAKDNIVALDWEIGEHNCALSQLKQKGSIGIDYFRIRGH